MEEKKFDEAYINEVFVYVSQELKHQRNKTGQTQIEVANNLGISHSNLSHVESGKGIKASMYLFIKLAHYYGIDIDTLTKNAMVKYNLDNPNNNKD
ncbi:helix-turn-helix domain-containing protein (plasmid) [Mammaliicoccus sciuri]|uniref:helix-turn-helix domain-containing protein n=1 Tax=Mammaliicoccus sciuri TaxID=1296 RepID=UPI002DB9C847|nr:helix-turn-helix transcriptional regulator [Mammaliicoccus sciuri]MEB5648572.1 helix-turn-helix domain-containing protein [Mammaliicoccus sciuri]MEB8265379.1 helix-turn-helix domain-containing protein [Mammaliicoccus sciuri]